MNDYLDIAAIARLLGVQPATVSRYKHRDPTFPPPDHYYGGRPVWRPATISTWRARRPGKGQRGRESTTD